MEIISESKALNYEVSDIEDSTRGTSPNKK
jgi:hypothetical protein